MIENTILASAITGIFIFAIMPDKPVAYKLALTIGMVYFGGILFFSIHGIIGKYAVPASVLLWIFYIFE